jgi:hypothetical protein
MWVSRFKYKIKVAPAKFELGATSCPAHVGEHLNQFGTLTNHLQAFNCTCQRLFSSGQVRKKEILSLRLYFYGSKTRLQQRNFVWLPRGNMSISQETSPQENHIFKPAQTPTYVDTKEIQEGDWRAVFATVRNCRIRKYTKFGQC